MIEHSPSAAKAGATVGIGAAGTSYTYLGLPMADLVGLGTLIYLLAQVIVIAPKVVAEIRRWFTRKGRP